MGRIHMILSAIVMLAGWSIGTAAEAEHNGGWWREQDLTEKYRYAARLFDGLTMGSNLLEFGMSAQVLVKGEKSADHTSGLHQYVRFDGGQLVEGIDKFYADPRNVNIPVSKASLLFVQSAAGVPRATVQRMTEEYRKPGC